jgi:glycosyltransferase involved in cell wall biosynthesis
MDSSMMSLMPTPRLSVVIPTYKRGAILRQCLDHLSKQTIAKDLEVIVVSDGEDAETAAVVKTHARATFLQIPKTQQGVARNKGLEHATAPLTLFIGDDIFLAPEACETHVHAHANTNEEAAVLGFTTWDPSLKITPVMRWLEATGWQFGYPMLEPYRGTFVPEEMQHRFTYTSHISLPTVIAKRTPFREDVTLYGWEDIEWGLRLRKAGVTLWYEPASTAYHHHPMTMEQSLKRMEELGESAVFLTKIAPELDRLPRGWKRIAYHVLAVLPTMRGKHAAAFMRGIKKGEKGAL